MLQLSPRGFRAAFLATEEPGRRTRPVAGLANVAALSSGDTTWFLVDMGAPRFDWDQIPLREPVEDTRRVPLQDWPQGTASVLSMGNPHAVLFVDYVEGITLGTLGPQLARDPIFPETANVSFAQIVSRQHIIVRVWERGAGATKACGTAACAALVAASRLGLAERNARISLPGGDLSVYWRADGRIIMGGPVSIETDHQINESYLTLNDVEEINSTIYNATESDLYYIKSSFYTEKVTEKPRDELNEFLARQNLPDAVREKLSADFRRRIDKAKIELSAPKPIKIENSASKKLVLPTLPAGLKWPTESFGQSPEAHTEDGIVRFLERVWRPLIAAGYAERRFAAFLDSSVITGINSYQRARSGSRKIPPHLRFLSVGEAKMLRARLQAEKVLCRILPGGTTPS